MFMNFNLKKTRKNSKQLSDKLSFDLEKCFFLMQFFLRFYMTLRCFLYNFVLGYIYFTRLGVDCLKMRQAISNS